ncbi:MAG: hypothetical protein WCF85_19845 [Rhodospirillaceae bacterium]
MLATAPNVSVATIVAAAAGIAYAVIQSAFEGRFGRETVIRNDDVFARNLALNVAMLSGRMLVLAALFGLWCLSPAVPLAVAGFALIALIPKCRYVLG